MKLNNELFGLLVSFALHLNVAKYVLQLLIFGNCRLITYFYVSKSGCLTNSRVSPGFHTFCDDVWLWTSGFVTFNFLIIPGFFVSSLLMEHASKGSIVNFPMIGRIHQIM